MRYTEQAYDKILQRMRELVPTCDPEGVYSVKRSRLIPKMPAGQNTPASP